jgi:quercetin dioxygenase-like cupin family protein
MKLSNLPEKAIDWSEISPTVTPGAAGAAKIRAVRTNDVQLRVVEYGPGYLADHWCAKGHILYVISGALRIEHQDGKETYELSAGMSWRSADGEGSPHRVRSTDGATVFIVD